MTTLTAGQLSKLRGQNHRSQFYLSVCPATALWSARVAGALDRGETAVTFDGGSGSDFMAVGAYQELWVGSSAGEYDVGRIRIRSISSGDSGVTGTVTVAANSIVYSDNDHLTFIGWYLPKPIRPLIGDNGTFYKDSDITYTDENAEPAPVAIAGENRVGFIDSGTGYFEIESQLDDSYAIADGASISSYSASLVYGAATPTISVNSGTGVGTIQFDTAGVYWIKWSVTDSNGKSQDTYRWYYAHDSSDMPVIDFSINNVGGSWNSGGWNAGIQVWGSDADIDNIPDFAPCILWRKDWYDDVEGVITYLPDSSGTIINGYIIQDRFSQNLEHGLESASFEITTIQGISDEKYNFSVSLEVVNGTPDTWYKYEEWLTPTRAVHHFLRWHSTVFQTADVIGLDQNTDGIAYAEFQDGTLIGIPDGFLRDRSIRGRLVCDSGGRIHFLEDIQLRPDSERSGLGQVQAITNDDKSGEVTYIREQHPKTPFVHTSGFIYSGGFDAEGKPDATAICAIAPGDDPLEDGPSPISFGKQTFTSQSHANAIAGRVLSTSNNEYPEIRITFAGNYLGSLGIHFSEFWQITIQTGDTARGISETLNLILRDITAVCSVENGTILCTAVFEAEAPSFTGISTDCPTYPDLEGNDFEIPDYGDMTGAVVTAASVHYLPPQNKSWTQRTAEATSHLYADPFWQIKQATDSSDQAILWRCGAGYIKRSTDAGQNWSDVTPGDPPNDAGDSPAPTAATVTFVQGEGSYIVEDEHIFIVRWQNSSSDWRSWLVYTDDSGTSWTYQSVGGGSVTGTVSDIVANTAVTHAQIPSIINMGNDRVVVTYNSSPGGSNFQRMALIDTANATILDTAGQGGSDTGSICTIVKLTATTLVLASENLDLDSFFCIVYDITGDTFTDKTGTETIHSGIGTRPTAMSVQRINDTDFIVSYNKDSSGNNRGVAIVGQYNGSDTITFGSATQFSTATISYMAMINAGGSEYHVFYDTGSALMGMKLSVSGTTITTNTAQTVSSSNALYVSAVSIDGSTKSIVSYADASDSNNGYIIACTLSSSSINKGSAVEFKNAAISGSYVAQSDTDSGYVAYRSGTGDMDYKSVSVSTHTISLGSETDYPSTGGFPVILDNKILGYYDDTNSDIFEVYLDISGTGKKKVLGLSIGRGSGLVFGVTFWNQTEQRLELSIRDITDLSETTLIELGSATESQLDANTYVAYPLAGWGDDSFFYVFGRMNNPHSLGTSQIIYTDDAGITFYLIEGSWGSSYCGSLVTDFGFLYAIRCTGAGSKLYFGIFNDKLTVVSTLPFTSGVNPFGLWFSFPDAALYCGAGNSVSNNIYKASEPFLEWENITYDHPAVGINAITVL